MSLEVAFQEFSGFHFIRNAPFLGELVEADKPSPVNVCGNPRNEEAGLDVVLLQGFDPVLAERVELLFKDRLELGGLDKFAEVRVSPAKFVKFGGEEVLD